MRWIKCKISNHKEYLTRTRYNQTQLPKMAFNWKNKRILIPIDLLHISCKLVLFENKLRNFVKTTFIIFMKILITVNFKQKKWSKSKGKESEEKREWQIVFLCPWKHKKRTEKCRKQVWRILNSQVFPRKLYTFYSVQCTVYTISNFRGFVTPTRTYQWEENEWQEVYGDFLRFFPWLEEAWFTCDSPKGSKQFCYLFLKIDFWQKKNYQNKKNVCVLNKQKSKIKKVVTKNVRRVSLFWKLWKERKKERKEEMSKICDVPLLASKINKFDFVN